MVHLEAEDLGVEGDGALDLADPEHGVVQTADRHAGGLPVGWGGGGRDAAGHVDGHTIQFKFELLPSAHVSVTAATTGGPLRGRRTG
ncbi:hypothetical protein GCM10010336_66000 [Streptomyces goshikiensis]|nr:hypothetical protein GCM10010336_66000 [Streptomyces goshikiensis]